MQKPTGTLRNTPKESEDRGGGYMSLADVIKLKSKK